MPRLNPTVLVPVNRLERAKGRLSSILEPGQRRELAILTLRTVVAAANECGANVIILTPDGDVATLGLEAQIEDEQAGVTGLNGQVEAWITHHRGLEELLILHADLPLANARAIDQLLQAARPSPSVTAVRSPDGGTNAMLLRPAGRFALAYGADSFARHRKSALDAGFAFQEHHEEALTLDLDTPGDIHELLERDANDACPAARFLRPIVSRRSESY